jgi:hypothetical protein
MEIWRREPHGAASKVFLTNPATVQFGSAALTMIMGKHTDKITRSEKRTLPKLLGYPVALFACGATIIAPHVLLLATFIKERLLTNTGGGIPSIPLGASLAFLTLLREVPSCPKILCKGKPEAGKPTIPLGTVYPGILSSEQNMALVVCGHSWLACRHLFVSFCNWMWSRMG